MDNELKLCPFCGKTPDYRGTDAHADDCYLVVVKRSTSPNDINEAWEERPIEDALRAEVTRLTAEFASETRWANEYHQQAERLQAELQHAREEIERLKSDEWVDHYRARLRQAQEALLYCEWDEHYGGYHGICPYCGQRREDGHMSECKIKAALPTPPEQEATE